MTDNPISFRLFLNPGNAVFRTEHDGIINVFLRIRIKLYHFNIARVIKTEHLRADLNTAQTQGTGANIYIWFFHLIFQKSIINYCSIPFEDLFGFRIKLVCDLMNLIFTAALFALHTDLSAHPQYFKLAATLLAFHEIFPPQKTLLKFLRMTAVLPW